MPTSLICPSSSSINPCISKHTLIIALSIILSTMLAIIIIVSFQILHQRRQKRKLRRQQAAADLELQAQPPPPQQPATPPPSFHNAFDDGFSAERTCRNAPSYHSKAEDDPHAARMSTEMVVVPRPEESPRQSEDLNTLCGSAFSERFPESWGRVVREGE